MKRFVGVLFFVLAFGSIAIGQVNLNTTDTVVMIDPTKPLSLKLEGSGLGAEFQCYYGRIVNSEFALFGVLFNSMTLVPENNFRFSETYQFSIVDQKVLDGLIVLSQISCWVSDQTNPEQASVVVSLFQNDAAAPVFEQTLVGFTRQGLSSLWVSSRPILSRIKFELSQ